MGIPRILPAALLLLAASTTATTARELVVDLSETVVAITTSFAGSDLLLFGTTESSGDVVVVVRGPLRDVIVRHKERIAGVWVNRGEMAFEQVPDYYALASNRPVDEFLSPEVRNAYQIGATHLELLPRDRLENVEEINAFRNALIRNKQREGLYAAKQGNVIFLGNRLFRTRIHFPANVSVGTYGVDIYLVQNGVVASMETTLLTVRKFGIAAAIYDFAHRNSALYGLLAILMAVMAGWLAGIVFRRT